MALVDLTQQGVGGVTEDSSSETSNDTTSKVDTELADGRLVVLVYALVDGLMHPLVDGELTDGVRDLLEENRDETGIETAETFGRGELGETGYETSCVLPSAGI